jgi:hypothetical protein
MVACHLNVQFQVLVFLKGTKELGMIHFTVDAPDSLKVSSHFGHHKRKTKFYGLHSLLNFINKCLNHITSLAPFARDLYFISIVDNTIIGYNLLV